ncbi:MAG: site-specific DNA-methyltransferase [Thauera sp.]|nr:site-specific DNA-methyltransferase [Thauera sp.]
MATRKPRSPQTAPAAGETAVGAYKPVDSTKHDKGQAPPERAHIPSSEEQGYEQQAIEGLPTIKNIALNPITTRGQDPELYWLGKYGAADDAQHLSVDIRSLYRHEHIAPEKIVAKLYSLAGKNDAQNELFTHEVFGNPLALDELDKPLSYYQQHGKWQNRLIQGDSELVMTSLLEREGMAGQVQCIYIDPPYGIKYGSNWQMRLNDRNVKDGADEHLSGEAEVIKAFRDTWELGIHSYLSYLRDRLLIARELLNESGSCFVQISDENVHLVRCVMDEVFGSGNFVSLISYSTTSGIPGVKLSRTGDYLVWYAKDVALVKYRQLFAPKQLGDPSAAEYKWALANDGSIRSLTDDERAGLVPVSDKERVFRYGPLSSTGWSDTGSLPFQYKGKSYSPSSSNHWKVTLSGLENLAKKGLIIERKSSLAYYLFLDNYPVSPIANSWFDTKWGFDAGEKAYVVQTNRKVIERCLLMTTDPGDLVLDPTCGSGTTAFVAEQWGRRWITTDTSRIALNIAKTRLMTATFPWYRLVDTATQDVRHGFVYKTVPHVTLKSLANNEPPETETLYDQPEIDKKKLRVAGPFTVETLQADEPLAPGQLQAAERDVDGTRRFIDHVFEHLKSAGVKNGAKGEAAVFTRVDLINDREGALHAEGWYGTAAGERKAYLHIGPQFGTVGRLAVNAAVKSCSARGDADWLLVLGFGFESDIENRQVTRRVGSFEVTKVRMHDDLMQAGLIKKDKKAASFVTIGEPDIALHRLADGRVQVEICGLDIYDPIRDEVKARSAADISYWMLDERYDGSNFVATQVFFCGGDKDEFAKFRRGLTNLAAASVKKNAEHMLKVNIDDEAFERVYGFKSHPTLPDAKNPRLAVRVISQFGEESTEVLRLDDKSTAA